MTQQMILLLGGPADFPDELRVRTPPADNYKVKIEHRGGYEHFERTDERFDVSGGQAVVFRWTTRTRIAE